MAVSYQLVIDCAAPDVLARFWAEALHYVIAPPPQGFGTWDDFYRSVSVSHQVGMGNNALNWGARCRAPGGPGCHRPGTEQTSDTCRWPLGRSRQKPTA